MYNNIYQEYINNMLGTIPKEQSNFEFDAYRNTNYFQNTSNIELERFYPEVYRLLYPMIQTACMKNTKPITEETINEMVNDIYSNFNVDDLEISNEVRSTEKLSEKSSSSNSKVSPKVSSEVRNQSVSEERNRRPNNPILNDLIRILLIRELLGRPQVPPNRPGFRPPFGPGGRPPFRPRSNDDIGIYEEPYMYFN